MSNIDMVLSVLDRVRPRGEGKWLACCPAHEDKTPSLAVALKDDRVLLHCFAGCSGVDIMRATQLDLQVFAPEGVLSSTDNRISSVFGPRPKRETSLDEYRLAIAKSNRAAGKKLTAAEKEWELQAYLRCKRGK